MNDIKAASFIAYKSITRSKKSTTALIVFILFLSFTNMMFISGILNGFAEMVPQMFIDEVSSHITIGPQQKPVVKPFIVNQTLLQSQIGTIPGVVATGRRYNLAGSVAYDKDKTGQYKSLSAGIGGIDPVEFTKVLPAFYEYTRYGQFLSPDDTDQIILSTALAGGYGDRAPDDLGGVQIGDKVRITYFNGMVRTYTVKGIWHDNMNVLMSFITVREAESVLGVSDNASQIFVKVDPSQNSLAGYLDKIKLLAPELKLQTYKEALGSFASLVGAMGLIASIVGTVSVLVAAVTLFILIYVNASTRRRQIGILRAIGVKQKIIVYSYMLQALFYTFIGLLFGSLVAFGVLYPLFLKYPLDVDVGKISLIFTPLGIFAAFASFLVAGILSGYIPSKIVAKQDIVKAIWY